MIGSYLKEIRKGHKIRISDIADLCGVSQPFISNVENEKRTPTVEMFFNILNAVAYMYPISEDIFIGLDLKDQVKTEFLDSLYNEDYNDFEIYEDPDYVKSLVTDGWRDFFLYDLLEKIGFDEFSDALGIDEANAIILNSLTDSEISIIKTVLELKNDERNGGGFSKYIPPKKEIESDRFDLKLLDFDDILKDEKLILDGERITKSDLLALRKIISGIRYDRLR